MNLFNPIEKRLRKLTAHTSLQFLTRKARELAGSRTGSLLLGPPTHQHPRRIVQIFFCYFVDLDKWQNFSILFQSSSSIKQVSF